MTACSTAFAALSAACAANAAPLLRILYGCRRPEVAPSPGVRRRNNRTGRSKVQPSQRTRGNRGTRAHFLDVIRTAH
jgi:hypothetical protein